MESKLVERSWFWRRLAVFGSLVFCGAIMLKVALWGPDTRLSSDIYTTTALLFTTTLLAYIGGSILDSRNEGKEALAAKVAEKSSPVETNMEVKP